MPRWCVSFDEYLQIPSFIEVNIAFFYLFWLEDLSKSLNEKAELWNIQYDIQNKKKALKSLRL